MPHNIHIYAGPEREGPALTGCIEGCEGSDVITPVRFGLTVNTFTFTTPGLGSYAYRCDIHPTTMTGVMIVEEGAEIPWNTAVAP